MCRLLLTTLLLLFAAPHAALAGVISLPKVATDPKYGNEVTVMSFSASAGERNRITVTRTGAGGTWTFVLHDDGAPVHVPTGCTAIDSRTASCVAYEVFVYAGDGDDTVTVQHAGAGDDGYGLGEVSGGDGADAITGRGTMTGGPGNDVLRCGQPCGSSVLAGGSGDDVLHGGDGNQTFSGDGEPSGARFRLDLHEDGAAGNDGIDGGAGHDQVSFEGRRDAATVDLAAGRSTGKGGERDRLTGIESVIGGEGDDRLLGDAGDNTLQGAAGDDRIDGRAGNDYVLGDVVPDTNEYSVGYTEGTPGADTLRGGAGNDRLDAGGERGDVLSGGPGNDTLEDGLNGTSKARTVRCGPGRDTVAFALQGQLVSDCEWLQFYDSGATQITLRPGLRANGLRFEWRCRQQYGRQCTMAIGAHVGDLKLARRQLTLPRLSRGAFLMRASRGLHHRDVVAITMVIQTGNTNTKGERVAITARWRVRL